MFGNKKKKIDKEEFYKKQQELRELQNEERINSFVSRDELAKLPIEDKINAIFDLLLLDKDCHTVNYLAKKYCKKKK